MMSKMQKKFLGRIGIFLFISSMGPFIWWMGGGTELNYNSGVATFISMVIGTLYATFPLPHFWEDYD